VLEQKKSDHQLNIFGWPAVMNVNYYSRCLISLRHEGEIVRLDLVKAHDKPATGKLRLRLDPKTLLIAKAVRTK